jgi:outer membrane cobalamin receptor
MMGGELSEGLGSVRVDLMVQRQRGVNDYDFTFNSGTNNFPMTRIGADYLEDMQSFKITLPSSSGATSFLIQNVSANRGTPGPVTDSAFVGTAREIDKNTVAILKNIGNLGVFNYSTSAGFIYSYLKYADPAYLTNDYYKMLSLQPAGQLSYSEEQFSGSTGLDAELDRGESDNMAGTKDRNRIGIFASGEYDLRKGSDLETRLFGALRYDDYSDFGSSLNPKTGINIKPIASLPVHLRANIGTSYRVPTFDDLYYNDLPYYSGNANLKPETSTDYDFGAVAEFNGNEVPFYVNLDLDYYHIDTRNGIVFQQVTDIFATEENLQKIISKGIELSLRLNYSSLFDLKGNYFFGKSLDVSDPSDPSTYEKQLIYIPQAQSSLIAEVTPGFFTFTAAIQYVGERFYTSDNTVSLSPYAVTNVSASVRVNAGSFEILPKASVDDLFNREYQVIPEYPLPGRTYRLGLSFQFNQDKE